MSIGERLAHGVNRMYDRMRDPLAFRIGAEDATAWDFDGVRRSKYALLVTFRRSGEPVPSPVWCAVDTAGRAYVQTEAATGKVRRIRNDPRVLLAPSTIRGRPRGAAAAGTARLLPVEEWPHAEATMAAAYGLGRRLYMRVFPMSDQRGTYIEISPAPAQAS
ncbi:MAG TPA: PPOX class F420-dependent oxidoreductase [Acidimicrobiales bacterium]|nr:PPOX class F420-dependent oxidoreductase [Acidimicrobiales bacterium]